MQNHRNKKHNTPNISPQSCAEKAINYSNSGDALNAIKYAKMALNAEPKNDSFLHIMGVLTKLENDNEQAAKYFEEAILVNNNNPHYYYTVGIIYKEMGRLEDSLNAQKKALKLANKNLLCLNELGLLYIELKNYREAMNSLQVAYKLDSRDMATCVNLSHLYLLCNKIPEAIELATNAISIDPSRPEPYSTLGKANIMVNSHATGITNLHQSIITGSKNPSYIHESILMNMLYPDCYSPEEILQEHTSWANTYLDQITPIDTDSYIDKNKDKSLNIGFVSADFKEHSIAYFLIPLLENINIEQCKIYCYSAVTTEDKTTEVFKQLSNFWRDISRDSEKETITRIKQDKIDILIDLSGHSLGTRLNVFNKKPAPVQFSYLGYPFSTGLKNIDYRITDNFADPKNTTEHLHSETLVRLEPSFLCYKPDKKTPICQNLPIENNEYITFGSFNNFSKLSKSTLQTWARILSSVKNSRLLLKNSISTSDLLKQNLLITFKEFGIDQNRIEFHQNINSRDEHMSYYNNVDICLDPFPYNGTTTTFEAIYMGVPVISLSGESHYSRVGFSILSNLKLNELIASSTEKYVEIAQNLSADVSRIKKYRCSLRETLLTSPLTDAKSFSDNFERLLRETWYSYCENNI